MTAARALGLGRTEAYDLARRQQFPCRVIGIGDTYRVPTERRPARSAGDVLYPGGT